MDVRTGAEANTTRFGAVALPLALIVFVVSTAIHPSREEPMDNPAVFMEYAQSQSWIAVHLAQWVAVLWSWWWRRLLKLAHEARRLPTADSNCSVRARRHCSDPGEACRGDAPVFHICRWFPSNHDDSSEKAIASILRGWG